MKYNVGEIVIDIRRKAIVQITSTEFVKEGYNLYQAKPIEIPNAAGYVIDLTEMAPYTPLARLLYGP